MKRTGFIIVAWLILLIPTLLIGGVALRLLQHEQLRLAGAATAAAGERARATAESIALAVAEVKDGLLTSLRELPLPDLADRLDAWKRENPLIRNVFIWSPQGGLALPDPHQPVSDEEAGFIRRYDSLFSGRLSWRPPAADPGPKAVADAAESLFSARQELRQLVQSKVRIAAEAEPMADTVAAAPSASVAGAVGASGWLPWFWENRFYLLGWVDSPDGSRRYGVEMETMALLSRLLGTLPATPPSGEVYALVDGNGEVVHQSGGPAIAADTPQLVALPIGPALPHWQVAVYTPKGTAGAVTEKSFLLLSSLVVGAFVAAILFGGSLLLWQAWRHQTDARRKTSFVANVSHELKTPLTTIRMYAELLGEGKIAEPAKRGRYLRVIVDESQRLSRLVNNLLDFGRLEQGRKTYSRTEFDLVDILRGLLDSQAVRIEGAGLALIRQLPDTPCAVRADHDAIEQAVLNLIDNALKYASGGGEIAVELVREAKTCRVRVLDRGPGVPAAQCQRIFEKFHRVDDSLTTRQPGSGLGLSIARQLLRDQGGDLTCSGRPGGGCCFEIVLPCERRTEP